MKQQRETNSGARMNLDCLPISNNSLNMIKVCANFQRILTLSTHTDVNFCVTQTAQLLEFHTLISAARVRFPAWRVFFYSCHNHDFFTLQFI